MKKKPKKKNSNNIENKEKKTKKKTKTQPTQAYCQAVRPLRAKAQKHRDGTSCPQELVKYVKKHCLSRETAAELRTLTPEEILGIITEAPCATCWSFRVSGLRPGTLN